VVTLRGISSWTRPTNKNNYLYNAATELNTNTNWYETPFRGYDPALGRFMQADPLAHQSRNLSPYRYGFNNPFNYNDPTGLEENAYEFVMRHVEKVPVGGRGSFMFKEGVLTDWVIYYPERNGNDAYFLSVFTTPGAFISPLATADDIFNIILIDALEHSRAKIDKPLNVSRSPDEKVILLASVTITQLREDKYIIWRRVYGSDFVEPEGREQTQGGSQGLSSFDWSTLKDEVCTAI
jgi:RHS repeat-associated protein